MANTVKFKIKSLPVSVNNAVRHSKYTSYKTKEFKEWEGFVEKETDKNINKSEWYGVEVVCYFPLYYKNGNIRRRDIDDMLKYAIDCTLKKVQNKDGEIDDKRVLEGSFAKIDSEEEYTEITFYCIGQ